MFLFTLATKSHHMQPNAKQTSCIFYGLVYIVEIILKCQRFHLKLEEIDYNILYTVVIRFLMVLCNIHRFQTMWNTTTKMYDYVNFGTTSIFPHADHYLFVLKCGSIKLHILLGVLSTQDFKNAIVKT